MNYDLPFLGLDLVTLPGGHLIAIDMQPLFQTEEYKKKVSDQTLFCASLSCCPTACLHCMIRSAMSSSASTLLQHASITRPIPAQTRCLRSILLLASAHTRFLPRLHLLLPLSLVILPVWLHCFIEFATTGLSCSSSFLRAQYAEPCTDIYEKHVKNLPWGGDFPEEAKAYFSPNFLWTRPQEDSVVQVIVVTVCVDVCASSA